MSIVLSTRAEIIKTKRSAASWIAILGAGMIPLILMIVYLVKPERNFDRGWNEHLANGWQMFAGFLLPMFAILICSLVPQIEYKNNAWKQVFASPQSIGNIFFSKYISIGFMIVVLFIAFNIFMIGAAVIPNLFFAKYKFLSGFPDWNWLVKVNVKTFVALLAIIAIQYWFSLRFKNFIVAIATGLGLLITAMTLQGWEHIDKFPYAFPFLSFMYGFGAPNSSRFFHNHELNSIVFFIVFTVVGYLDLRFRKERG